MSILNSIAMDSALHASNAQAGGTRISPEMGSGKRQGDGILEREFAPYGHAGEVITYGRWPLEADSAPEPLQWRIIGVRADGMKLAVTLDVIDQRSAHDFDGDVNWQLSSIRYWLHKVFMRYAFNDEERRHIPPVKLVTFDNEAYQTVGCFGTTDRVFLLSSEEAQFFFLTDQARCAHRTGYTKRLPSLPCWWLRSPGGHQFAFGAVNEKGAIDSNGFQTRLGNIGVRPAILITPAPIDDDNASLYGPDDYSFCGRHALAGTGNAIAYADEATAKRELEKSGLAKTQPDLAVHGGYPSVLLIHKLLDEKVLGTKERFAICKSAIHAHENSLFKRIVDQRDFGEYRLSQLLNTCVSEGSLELATFLISRGASGEGYARAYLPSATQEATALCAVAIDPEGAILQWEHVRRHPSAVKQLIASFAEGQDGAGASHDKEKLFKLPDVLSTCAANGFLGEAYYLVSEGERYLSAKQFAEAIQEAKFHNHAELTAYLIDRQAELFGSTTFGMFATSGERDLGVSSIPSSAPRSQTQPQEQGFTNLEQGQANQEFIQATSRETNQAPNLDSSQEPNQAPNQGSNRAANQDPNQGSNRAANQAPNQGSNRTTTSRRPQLEL